MTRLLFLALVLGTWAALPSPVQAQGQGGRERAKAQTAENAAGFSQTERNIIIEFFAEHRQQVRPLPPGIAKNLQRGKPLPPGIAKQRVPTTLQQQLSTREGVEVSIFGDRVVLLEASGLVVDILEGVFK